MNNNAWFKKEIPLQTVIGFGGGATGFGAHSSVASKPYIDDVFSTYLYAGNETIRNINNGINLSTKNGLVWVKSRNDTHDHHLVDTVRGANKILYSNLSAQETNTANRITGFNNDGFTLGTAGQVNGTSAYEYSSWTFREQKGFFDIVTWTGDGSGQRNISHNLGCNIGSIMARRINGDVAWNVWHSSFTTRNGLATNSAIYLQSTEAINQGADPWGYPNPSFTSTTFSVDSRLNDNGHEYIAYLFAGGLGSSDKAVSFDGTDDKLTWAATSDFTFGTGAYTVEYWIYYDNLTDGSIVFSQYTNANGGFVISSTTGKVAINSFGVGDVVAYNTAPATGEWIHYAFVRESTSSNKTYIFVNGELKQTGTDTTDWNTTQISALGGNAHPTSTQYTDCKISNFRITKGQALYTTNFNVPHDPLTQTSQGATTSNVKLICCNGDTTTASTVTPGTITEVSSPSVSTSESIFDDRSAYVFGDNEDQGVVKTGLYYGNGSSTGPEIFLGWEPQWILIRNLNDAESWPLYDSMRGISNGSADVGLYPNDTYAEYSADLMELTSTGFKIVSSAADINDSGDKFMYWAIRRPDGYVGKLPSAATNVFAMDTWVSDSTPGTQPNMISNFPVDFVIDTDPTHSSGGWEADRFVRTRQIENLCTKANSTDQESSGSWGFFDYSTGWFNRGSSTGYTDWTSWMWKRGKGMDVVVYKGYAASNPDSGVREIRHSLNAVPEMIWLKRRDASGIWFVGNKDLNGGTNPWNYYIELDGSGAEQEHTTAFDSTAPTSTVFTVGADNAGNGTYEYVAYLFASANDEEGNPISKVGSYSGSSSSVTVTTGFQPRFVLIKRASGIGQWTMFDTFRGWTAGNDQKLELSDNGAQSNTFDYGEPTATGFTITTGQSATNNNGDTYLYYAHA